MFCGAPAPLHTSLQTLEPTCKVLQGPCTLGPCSGAGRQVSAAQVSSDQGLVIRSLPKVKEAVDSLRASFKGMKAGCDLQGSSHRNGLPNLLSEKTQ